MKNAARADTALTADPFAPSSFSLGFQRTAGWKFTVSDHLSMTHLGLYDWQADGFEISYPIGLWDSGGALLVQAELPAGAAAPFVDGFRYVSLESAANVILSPGQIYTIGYFQTTLAGSDRVLHFGGFHQGNPLLTQVGGGYVTDGPFPGLTFPDQPFLEFTHWIGPSFQFNVVPSPGAACLFALAAGATGRRRRG